MCDLIQHHTGKRMPLEKTDCFLSILIDVRGHSVVLNHFFNHNSNTNK